METASSSMLPLPGQSGFGRTKSDNGRGECGRFQPTSDRRRDSCSSVSPESTCSQVE
jgi:hypothetical protein